MKLSRDSILAIGLIFVLVTITVAAAIHQINSQEPPAFTTTSTRPNGSKALSEWLGLLNYDVQVVSGTEFSIPTSASLGFMLEPQPGITSLEWEHIDEWVEAGGTLIIAGKDLGTIQAVSHYNFRVKLHKEIVSDLNPSAPIFTSPPLFEPVNLKSSAYLESDRTDFAVLFTGHGEPIMVSTPQGAGRIIISVAPFPFSNEGLKEHGNAVVVLNLVRSMGAGKSVWFDEWHHGFRDSETREISGPTNWLRYTPVGQALLYFGAIIFLALIMRGRIFGRPVSIQNQAGRPAPVEHITALANLSRRAAHRYAVLNQYHGSLKRHLGKRYHLDPMKPDHEFAADLTRMNPNLDSESLLTLLRKLQDPGIGENEMVKLAAEVAEWISTQSDQPRF